MHVHIYMAIYDNIIYIIHIYVYISGMAFGK